MKFNKSAAEALFHKHFIISENTENNQNVEEVKYVLPKPECMFREEPWQKDSLQTLKNELNDVKSRLNNFTLDEWQQHTYQMNQAGDVLNDIKKHIQPEFITQAWCKFYEIVCNFSLVPLNKIQEINEENICSFSSVHLCEAPGAFVVALNHWLKLNAPSVKWDWIASTLNPYCEGNPYSQMIDDDRFIRHTLMHWYFGADNTGNIMDLQNLDALVERSKTISQGPIMLITADGSIDCTDMPDEQENAVVHLHFCEIVTCMHLLEKGGNFLLKVFTLFEHQSVCLMYLLACAFQKVIATKPATSRAGNSEMYIVCTNFNGRDYIEPYLNVLRCHYDACPTQATFGCNVIPDYFMRKIEDCARFFKRHQCKVIEDNINAFHSETYDNLLFKLKHFKRKISDMYLKRYKLAKIDLGDQIIGRDIIERNTKYIMSRKLRYDSYNERCRKQDSTLQERLQQIWSKASDIEILIESPYIVSESSNEPRFQIAVL
ncbi:Uncharacterized protein FLJ11171 [Harpegnathos saltator]|uniref:Cap-specific mRNA (nucleoside-2'-O-)-methyltransferase 2 n=1 Tax=Harpegnathos saltator TaxID=610380 RepID=E2B777_HARSA|nr:Uncharacterized protein FLJ11171 [Harpegnathos saltator]